MWLVIVRYANTFEYKLSFMKETCHTRTDLTDHITI